jgi:hypothetical protein
MTVTDKGAVDKAYLVGNFFDYNSNQMAADQFFDDNYHAHHLFGMNHPQPNFTNNISFGLPESYRTEFTPA